MLGRYTRLKESFIMDGKQSNLGENVYLENLAAH